MEGVRRTHRACGGLAGEEAKLKMATAYAANLVRARRDGRETPPVAVHRNLRSMSGAPLLGLTGLSA